MRHLLLIAGLLLTPAWSQKTQTEAPKKSEQALEFEALLDCKTEKPTELFRVTRVVDGDTLWIDRYGKQEKLRLLSVDTEEKFVPGNQYSDTKPYTWFGNECAAWTRGFFAPRNPDQEEVLVGLSFPQNIEARDVYGRLLCHVVTEEGIDFNLLLVRRGMSPYFNKYGNSRICHERFLAAQKKARAAGLGIWNPQAHPDGNHRPYDRLLPWWNVRAQAVEDFRVKSTAEPLRFVNSEEPEALEAALKNGPRASPRSASSTRSSTKRTAAKPCSCAVGTANDRCASSSPRATGPPWRKPICSVRWRSSARTTCWWTALSKRAPAAST
ncbi:MAG: thermonuclease family protein [Planctomycetota bacterium]